MDEKEELKKIDEEITAVLKKYNCTLSVNHVISINKIKEPEVEIKTKDK